MEERIQIASDELVKQIEQARLARESGERLEGLEGLARQFKAAQDLGWFIPDTELQAAVPSITVVETVAPEIVQAELKHTLAIKNLRERALGLLKFALEPTEEEMTALTASEGVVFFPMRSQPYAGVVAEHPEHFWPDEERYARARKSLRESTLPVEVQVGLNPNPKKLALPGSFGQSRNVGFQMIAEYSERLATKFPGFMALPLLVTGYAIADRTHAERNPGQVLFPNFFAWGLDNLSGGFGAGAGRDGPAGQCHVSEWDPGAGYPFLGAVPAVVKIGTK